MTENDITNKLLSAALGYLIANKDETVFAHMVYLAAGDSADNYHEVTIEYANSRIAEGGEKYTPGTLSEAKAQKIAEITAYDCSDAVNALTYKGVRTWLTAEVRNSYLTSIQAAELLGEKNITFDIGGQSVTLDIQSAKIMLAKLQRYADASYLVTQQHIAEVSKLTTVAEVTAYDITAGYPTKLTF